MTLYFTFGLGFYIGLTCNDPTSFTQASVAGLLRGIILGIILWPIGLVYAIIRAVR